jgi:hypothetical protein
MMAWVRSMAFEFDHAFVFVEAGAPDADILAAAGLVEGAPNIHPGQGTQNRRFFFQNGMIEFLWVHSTEEARSVPIARTRLLERFRYKLTGACPFGIGLSRTKGEMKNSPFNTWPYRPPYLPGGVKIAVADVSQSPEKLFAFVVPGDGSRPKWYGDVSIRKVQVRYPAWDFSDFGDHLGSDGLVSLSHGTDPFMQVSLNMEREAQRIDLRPSTPLVIEW